MSNVSFSDVRCEAHTHRKARGEPAPARVMSWENQQPPGSLHPARELDVSGVTNRSPPRLLSPFTVIPAGFTHGDVWARPAHQESRVSPRAVDSVCVSGQLSRGVIYIQ